MAVWCLIALVTRSRVNDFSPRKGDYALRAKECDRLFLPDATQGKSLCQVGANQSLAYHIVGLYIIKMHTTA
jgi:hypothetical protein